ncbi:hypothetical protein GGS23DRAFT_576408 [Durotheca rogersii]|uniref:uncharacterized protein n=1 Tax=Durotheca rogersii TaxID=419775 RepID=UPI002220BC30|nr:uncharacterized protein GGS23DRAFT_576408 [Durotheca rogersii]KAI5861341.1 hypothetical protein GGS23DRAFT_576408 [Durotheca rogersii]
MSRARRWSRGGAWTRTSERVAPRARRDEAIPRHTLFWLFIFLRLTFSLRLIMACYPPPPPLPCPASPPPPPPSLAHGGGPRNPPARRGSPKRQDLQASTSSSARRSVGGCKGERSAARWGLGLSQTPCRPSVSVKGRGPSRRGVACGRTWRWGFPGLVRDLLWRRGSYPPFPSPRSLSPSLLGEDERREGGNAHIYVSEKTREREREKLCR